MKFIINKHPSFGLRLKINRPLTCDEKTNKLNRIEYKNILPHYWGSLVKINNTYLEVIDINYQRKGLVPVVIAILFAMMSIPISMIITIFTNQNYQFSKSLFEGTFFSIILLFLFVSGLWMLSQEFFTYTHCPIRLNRKTRMVHVFRQNGTILTVPWEDVHFVITKTRWMGIGKSYIAAHVLDESRQIIQETFVLGGYLTPREEITLSMWEFFRRYMEEGPQFIAEDKLLYCLPIDRQKESFDLGDTLIRFSQWVPGTPVLGDFMSIVLFFESLARWISTMTCRIPRWPKEIEDACRIEPDDPYLRDGSTNDVRASLAPSELGFR